MNLVRGLGGGLVQNCVTLNDGEIYIGLFPLNRGLEPTL